MLQVIPVSMWNNNCINRNLRVVFLIITVSLLPFSITAIASQNIELGDLYFREMNYKKAVCYYQQDSTNSEALWKMARAYLSLAEISGTEERRMYAEKAKGAAERCMVKNKNLSYGHTMYAASLGMIAVGEGSKSKVRMSTVIKKELDIAIALNPRDDIAYSLLGSFYRILGKVNWFERGMADAFLGGLPEGGFAEGETAFKKAIELAPDYIRHWEELGKLYKEWGKTDKAREALTQVLKLKPQVQSDFGKIAKARSILEELE